MKLAALIFIIAIVVLAGCVGRPASYYATVIPPSPAPTIAISPTPEPTPTPMPTPYVTDVPQGPTYRAPKVRIQYVENGMAALRIDNPSNVADSYDIEANGVLYQRTPSVEAGWFATAWAPGASGTVIKVTSTHGGGSTSVTA